MACALTACGLQARTLDSPVVVSVDTMLTYTTNTAYGSGKNGDADFLVLVSPAINFEAQSTRLHLEGKVELDSFSYLQHTQPSRVLPQADIKSNLMLVERLAGVDAALVTRRTTANSFASQGSDLTSSNIYTTTQARISPYIEHEFTPFVSMAARSEVSKTHFEAVGNGVIERPNATSITNTVELVRKPAPVGAGLQYTHDSSGYDNKPRSNLTRDAARGNVSYALSDQWVLGAIGGGEKIQTDFSHRSDGFGGGLLRWRPTERTDLNALAEHHFYGPTWDVSLTHRTPTFAALVRLQRIVESSANSIGELSSGSSLSALLDAMLTTRYPDAVQRAQVVNDAIAGRGLTDSADSVQDYYSLSVDMQQTATVRFAMMGKRNTISVGYTLFKTSPERWAQDPLVSILEQPNHQHAFDIQYNHQLTGSTSFDAIARWSRTTTPGLDRYSVEKSLTAAFNLKLSPKTAATLGGRRQLLDSNVVEKGVNESAVFVGLSHRF